MKFPRPRLTVRRMMVVVAVFAVASLGAREAWTWWLRRGYRNPVAHSTLVVGQRGSENLALVPGRPVPISIDYDFKFNLAKPAPGTTALLWASVWFEDLKTGRHVDGYAFDAALTVGGREAASGRFTWEAEIPHPGKYQLCYRLFHGIPREPQWQGFIQGGGYGYRFVEADPSNRRPIAPRSNP